MTLREGDIQKQTNRHGARTVGDNNGVWNKCYILFLKQSVPMQYFNKNYQWLICSIGWFINMISNGSKAWVSDYETPNVSIKYCRKTIHCFLSQYGTFVLCDFNSLI